MHKGKANGNYYLGFRLRVIVGVLENRNYHNIRVIYGLHQGLLGL